MNSSIKLKDILLNLEQFNPIKVVYNNEVMYDDTIDGFLNDFKLYKDFCNNYSECTINKVNITIVQFHHSILELEGSKC